MLSSYCVGFSGRKLLFCFLPPNLLFISFSASSCCLSKAHSLSPTHFLFLIYPCVSLSPLQSHHPPHLHTSLDFTFFFCLCSIASYWEKEREKVFQSVPSSFATFFFSVCGRNFQSVTLRSWLQVLHFIVIVAKQSTRKKKKKNNLSVGIWRCLLKYWGRIWMWNSRCRILIQNTSVFYYKSFILSTFSFGVNIWYASVRLEVESLPILLMCSQRNIRSHTFH